MIEDMDKGGVATSIMSPTTPQVTPLGKDTAVRVARESNEYAKKLMADHPGRFGVFATLPLPHIDESLKEIAYAFDTLKVDGVGIMTSYGDKWLGDPTLLRSGRSSTAARRRSTPIRPAPIAASTWCRAWPSTSIEFGTDTTRTIASLILSGTSQKYKDINWIWSHGGGALTSFAERFLMQMVNTPPYKGKFTREIDAWRAQPLLSTTPRRSRRGDARRARQARADLADRLRHRFPVPDRGRPHQGRDRHFKGDDLKKVDRENALRLLPRLKSA